MSARVFRLPAHAAPRAGADRARARDGGSWDVHVSARDRHLSGRQGLQRAALRRRRSGRQPRPRRDGRLHLPELRLERFYRAPRGGLSGDGRSRRSGSPIRPAPVSSAVGRPCASRFAALPGYPLPVRMFYAPIRAAVPASGLFGGHEGTIDVADLERRRVGADSEIRRDGWVMFRDDADELTFHVASGGGYGDPARRDPAAIEADMRAGLRRPNARCGTMATEAAGTMTAKSRRASTPSPSRSCGAV